MKKNNKKNVIILVILILIIVLVIVTGIIISNIKRNKSTEETKEEVVIDDYDNVSIVDDKLKEGDYRVTQSYLLNYTRKKSSIWYRSKGIVTKIKDKDNYVEVTIVSEDDKSKSVVTTIDRDNLSVKEKDVVNFVGTINLKDGTINLARLSKEEINYNNIVDISLSDLVDNIYYVKNTYVIVSGYMITVADKYKLYSSKEDYKKDEENNDYFLIEWGYDFNLTGTKEILLRCFIGDRNKLIGCEFEE